MATKWEINEAIRQATVRIEAQYQAVNHPLNVAAMDQLKALLTVPGALKIITNEPISNPPEGLLPQHPHFWVASDVVRIEGPDHNGNVTAFAAKDPYTGRTDRCKGHAHALLGRLTQYNRAAEFTEERAELGIQQRLERQMAGDVNIMPEKPMSAK